MRKLSVILTLVVVSLISGCATPDAEPGINKREMNALVTNHYWKREWDVGSRHTEESLTRLMKKSMDRSLDGESAEGYTSALVLSIADAGDQLFVKTLAKQSLDIQKKVAWRIRTLCSYNELSYPLTQAFADDLAL